MNHMPGPWHVIYGQKYCIIRREKSGNARDYVAEINWSGHEANDPHQANARLIAAAPELLEALDKAYLQIIKFLNEGDFKREVVFDAGYIVDALKKARGE